MKQLSLWQPWASMTVLIDPRTGLPFKRFETRSWSTPYRGPLAILSTLKSPEVAWGGVNERDVTEPWSRAFNVLTEQPGCPLLPEGGGWWSFSNFVPFLPLGVVLGVCDLVDVIPIAGPCDRLAGPFVYVDPDFIQVHDGPDDGVPLYLEDERHFGDYRPGRFAWRLENMRPLPTPVPAKGAQGLRDIDPAVLVHVLAQLEEARHG